MAECTPDATPAKVLQTAGIKDSSEVSAAFRVRPADLGMIRNLSKSDSDLLASPLGEEDGGLAGRSGSVSNCRAGQPSKERMPSFASEWDEVIIALSGRETSGRVQRREGVTQAFKWSVLMSLRRRVLASANVRGGGCCAM